MRNYFFKNIIFFFSFCILTENGKSAADIKVVCGSNVPKLRIRQSRKVIWCRADTARHQAERQKCRIKQAVFPPYTIKLHRIQGLLDIYSEPCSGQKLLQSLENCAMTSFAGSENYNKQGGVRRSITRARSKPRTGLAKE